MRAQMARCASDGMRARRQRDGDGDGAGDGDGDRSKKECGEEMGERRCVAGTGMDGMARPVSGKARAEIESASVSDALNKVRRVLMRIHNADQFVRQMELCLLIHA